MEDKLIIDDLRKQKIFYICSTLVKGRSAPKLAESLKTFITDVIKAKDAPFFKQIISEHHIPSESSLKRLLYDGERAYLMLGHHPYLEKILNMYIDHYQDRLPVVSAEKTEWSPANPQAAFSPAAIDEIADYASNMCSAPGCYHPTSGPSRSGTGQPVRLGAACLIQGLTEDDPRFDADAFQPESNDTENGIWLCVYHAQLVNEKSNGYNTALLKNWKESHVALMQSVVEGRRRISIAMRQEDDRKAPVAAALLEYFNGLPFLFSNSGDLSHSDMLTGVKEMRRYLEAVDTGYGTLLQREVLAMDVAGYVFGELAGQYADDKIYCLTAALQKAIGLCLYTIAAAYKLKIPIHINTIVPQMEAVPEEAR